MPNIPGTNYNVFVTTGQTIKFGVTSDPNNPPSPVPGDFNLEVVVNATGTGTYSTAPGYQGLAILSTVSTSRVTHALHAGAALPAALTHGFKGAFIVAAILCAAGAALALVLLPRRKRDVNNEEVEALAFSFARCPGAPYCGHLARLVAFGRRIRGRPVARN